MVMSQRTLVIMTRVPRPGKTKTRMMPHLTAEECAHLHFRFLEDLARTCQSVDADITICHDGTDDEEGLARLRPLFGRNVRLAKQAGATLGGRMHRAFEQAARAGYESCVVIGADCPEIDRLDLENAYEALKSHDMVFGPTFDGGFYLAGSNEGHAEAFSLPNYGHEEVLVQTLERAGKAGLTYATLPFRHDLDTWADALALLERAKRHEALAAQNAQSTVSFLSRILEKRKGRKIA